MVRCLGNLEDEKKEGKEKVRDCETKCDKREKEVIRVKAKETKQCEKDGKELGNLLSETVNTLEYTKQQTEDYKTELKKCREERKCEGADSVTLRQKLKDDEAEIDGLRQQVAEEEEEIKELKKWSTRSKFRNKPQPYKAPTKSYSRKTTNKKYADYYYSTKYYSRQA